MAQLSIFEQQQQESKMTEETLPSGWAWMTIGEVTEPIAKVNPSARPDEEIIYLDISSIDNAAHMLTNHKVYKGKDAPSRARQLVRAGDVLFSTVRTYLENIALVPKSFDGQVASTGFSVLRGKAGVSSRYLFYFTLTTQFLSTLEALQRGTSYPAVRDADIRGQPIPLAPTAEQDRIVSAIEERFTRLDAGVAALTRAQANLKRYKAAVLKAACEGTLVPQDPSDEPADALLARILTERRTKWEADLRSRGKSPATARYDEPAALNTAGLAELPDGWCWASVEQAGKVQLGRQRSPRNRSKEYPTKYIRAANITEDGLDLTDILDMDFLPHEREIYALAKNDIVLSEASGSPDQVGKPAIWNDETGEYCFQNTVIRLRPFGFDSHYLLLLFQNFYVNGIFAQVAGGVGINHLSAGKFARLPIPMAPSNEQQRIVAEVERRLSVVLEQEIIIAHCLTRTARLRQAILTQAFAGRLVPQDPEDEQANVLLERIRMSGKSSKEKVTSARQSTMGGNMRRNPIPLYEALLQSKKPLTPVELLLEAGLDANAIDAFYAELKLEVIKGRIEEIRPNNADVFLKAMPNEA